MLKYKVTYRITDYASIVVETEDESEARDIAANADAEEFTNHSDFSWNFDEIERLDEPETNQ